MLYYEGISSPRSLLASHKYLCTSTLSSSGPAAAQVKSQHSESNRHQTDPT